MARLRSYFIVRYDAPVGPPMWLARETSTTRARAIRFPTVRSASQARLFRTVEEAQEAIAQRPKANRAAVEKVVR